MTPRDWTLVVIAAAQGEAVSPVQLQKALFLIGRNVSTDRRQTETFYAFEPYDYGPFDQAIYLDAEQLEVDGYVIIARPPFRPYKEYLVTAKGVERASILLGNLDLGVQGYLDRIVQWVRSLSFNDLVRAIYQKYPDMKVKSVFRDP